MKKFFYKAFVCIVSIVLLSNHFLAFSTEWNEKGDFNQDGYINSIDLAYMIRVLLYIDTSPQMVLRADTTLDNNSNILDLVNIKKYLLGHHEHSYSKIESQIFYWTNLNEIAGVDVIGPVIYNISVNNEVKTNKLSHRYTDYIGCATRAIDNSSFISPRIRLEIANATLNSTVLTLTESSNIWAEENWIWQYKNSNNRYCVGSSSEFNTKVIAMYENDLFPYRSVDNILIF